MATTTSDLSNYRQLIKSPDAAIWAKSYANDFGRLAQGVGTKIPTETNTISFISKPQLPKDRKVSYTSPVALIRSNKPRYIVYT